MASTTLTPTQAALWAALRNEALGPGPHCPANELTFAAFAEALVRVAALRYADVPNLERRFSQLVNYHLLPLLPKTSGKGAAMGTSLQPPVPAWPEHVSLESLQITLGLQSLAPGTPGEGTSEADSSSSGGGLVTDMQAQFLALARGSGTVGSSTLPALAADGGPVWCAEVPAGVLAERLEASAAAASTAAAVVDGEDGEHGVSGAQGLVPGVTALIGALCHSYLHKNAYTASDRCV